ncbi:hypothetical protein [Burkholderia sp. Ac-20365]|uniref:hypothetical protein n=1 Tax=Burkholderia sp. Ac-20365 TaxID=2703897 RepID=UPI00197BDD51|nr:hypothetical protein [Burkholderia sp. Ac-20365]MBN3761274.1 hypothetical protein [Burkholderia sp. Ac-20365]
MRFYFHVITHLAGNLLCLVGAFVVAAVIVSCCGGDVLMVKIAAVPGLFFGFLSFIQRAIARAFWLEHRIREGHDFSDHTVSDASGEYLHAAPGHDFSTVADFAAPCPAYEPTLNNPSTGQPMIGGMSGFDTSGHRWCE